MLDGKNIIITDKTEIAYHIAPILHIVTVTDSTGKIVSEKLEYNLGELYKYSLRKISYNLGIDKLAPGSYSFKLEAAIARGSVVLEDFEFTVK